MKIQKIDTVVFDLDGTLIRTEDLKIAFKQIAMDYDCSKEEADEVYRSARTCRNSVTGREEMAFSRLYFEEKLKEFLKKKNGEEPGEINFSRLDKVLEEGILVEGAIELIQSAVKRGLRIMLITLGIEEWQIEKLRAAGLDEYFSFGDDKRDRNIIITRDNELSGGRKLGAMRDAFGDNSTGRGILFVNDKPWETKNLSLQFPEMYNLVVRDERDARYTETDFERAQRETREAGGHFVWSQDLSSLKTEFERLCEVEKYDGRRL